MLCIHPLGRKVARGYDVVEEVDPKNKMMKTRMRDSLGQEPDFSNDDCILDLDRSGRLGVSISSIVVVPLLISVISPLILLVVIIDVVTTVTMGSLIWVLIRDASSTVVPAS